MSRFGKRYESAVARFLELNGEDPTMISVDGQPRPKERVAAERLADWVQRLAPDGSEALHLAAYCQHLQRWEIPRSSYDEGRVGYLKWRKDLSRFHADRASAVLRDLGYDESTVEAVRQINMKLGLQTNPDCATMENALCLSFLQHEFAEFAAKHSDEKVVDIVSKTWKKMTPAGHAAALRLELEPRAAALVNRALAAD